MAAMGDQLRPATPTIDRGSDDGMPDHARHAAQVCPVLRHSAGITGAPVRMCAGRKPLPSRWMLSENCRIDSGAVSATGSPASLSQAPRACPAPGHSYRRRRRRQRGLRACRKIGANPAPAPAGSRRQSVPGDVRNCVQARRSAISEPDIRSVDGFDLRLGRHQRHRGSATLPRLGVERGRRPSPTMLPTGLRPYPRDPADRRFSVAEGKSR